MTARRALTLGILLASLLVGGRQGLLPHVGAEKTGAIATASAFVQAAAALETFHRQAGSFAGAELGPALPVQIAWAGETSYCLQGGGLYEIGPGGVPQAGACPAV